MSDDLKALLLKARIPEGAVHLDGVGTITVRGLTRAETMVFNQKSERLTKAETEIWALSVVMIDPALTEDEVRTWHRSATGGEIEQVVRRSLELSGLAEGADKSDVQGVRNDAEPGV